MTDDLKPKFEYINLKLGELIDNIDQKPDEYDTLRQVIDQSQAWANEPLIETGYLKTAKKIINKMIDHRREEELKEWANSQQ